MKTKLLVFITVLVLLSACGKKYVYEAKPSEYSGYYNNEYITSVLSIDSEDFSDLIQGESRWGIPAATSLNDGYLIVAHGGPNLLAVDPEYAEFAGSMRAEDLHIIIFDQNSNILRIDKYPLYTMDFEVQPHIVQNKDYIVISGVGVKEERIYVEYSLFYTYDGKFVKETDYIFRANNKITEVINYFNVGDDTYVAVKEYRITGSMSDVGKSYLMKFDKDFDLEFVKEIKADLSEEEVFSLKSMAISTDGEIVLVGTKNKFSEEIDGYVHHEWINSDMIYAKYNLDGEYLSQEIINRLPEMQSHPDIPEEKIYIWSIKQKTVSDNIYFFSRKDQVINLFVVNTKTNESKEYRIDDPGNQFREAIEFDGVLLIVSYDKVKIYDNETFILIDEFELGFTVSNYINGNTFSMVLLGINVEIYEMEMRKK